MLIKIITYIYVQLTQKFLECLEYLFYDTYERKVEHICIYFALV